MRENEPSGTKDIYGRNARQSRTVSLRLARQSLAANRGLKQWQNHILRLAICQAVNLPLVLQPFFSIWQAPGPPTIIFKCLLCSRRAGCSISNS